MIQIIPKAQRQPSSKDRFAQAFNNLGSSLAQDIPEELLGRQERKQLGSLIGEDVNDIRNPQFMQQILASGLSAKKEQQKKQAELEESKEDYETINRLFGKDAADLHKAFTTGGQTDLAKKLLDSLIRGETFSDKLSGKSPPDIDETPTFNENEISKGSGKLDLPDYTQRPKGTTPASWEKTRKDWTKANVEFLNTARDRLKGNKRDLLGTQKLQKLSADLPQGLERLLINPKTGEPYKLAQLTEKVPTAVQEWTKEIARFGNRAKDAFGSRVTNFDLFQYMKQFPSLLNSKEGRDNILRMMEINYELDSLYDRAIQRIIDQKGAGNIPPDEVDKVARSLIKEREEQLYEEYLNIENTNDSLFLNENSSNEKQSLEDIFG